MLGRLDAIELEFEYLNKEKMPSLDAFLRRLETFVGSIPPGLPIAVETRNANYLKREYFAFLKEKKLAHVFSEKLHMPHVWETYEEFGDLLGDFCVFRLLGGDRKEIEAKTKEVWNSIVDPKPGLERIVQITKKISFDGKRAIVSFNNHYEGSAPLTIAHFLDLWEK